MITKYKKFNKDGPQVGDYVLCEEDNNIYMSDSINDLISNSIGVIIEIDINYDNPYCVYFSDLVDSDLIKKNRRWFSENEIKHYSSDIEDINLIVKSNKYNI